MRIGITEILVILVIVLVVKVLLDLFMNTKAGFLLRAEGDNPAVVARQEARGQGRGRPITFYEHR